MLDDRGKVSVASEVDDYPLLCPPALHCSRASIVGSGRPGSSLLLTAAHRPTTRRWER